MSQAESKVVVQSYAELPRFTKLLGVDAVCSGPWYPAADMQKTKHMLSLSSDPVVGRPSERHWLMPCRDARREVEAQRKASILWTELSLCFSGLCEATPARKKMYNWTPWSRPWGRGAVSVLCAGANPFCQIGAGMGLSLDQARPRSQDLNTAGVNCGYLYSYQSQPGF